MRGIIDWNFTTWFLLLVSVFHDADGFSVVPHSSSSSISSVSRTFLLLSSAASSSSSSSSSTVTSSPTPCFGYSIRDSFNLIVLGDLHLEDDMTFHEQARKDCMEALKQLSLLPCPPPTLTTSEQEEEQQQPKEEEEEEEEEETQTQMTVDTILSQLQSCRAGDLSATQLEMLLTQKRQGEFMKSYLVSLGDLGRKDIRHQQGDAGTTTSFTLAKTYLEGFHLPYELVTGNHDLEGLDEFHTDQDNLSAWMHCFQKVDRKPYFHRYIGERTLLLGLSTVRFRDAPYSSHECHIDDEQLGWFTSMVQSHPDSEGWRIFVFSHAPIMGSGLRVLQNVHVMNGCAWLNHCSTETRFIFIDLVQKHAQIKLWFSGHFHLSHDFQDALSRVNQCTFVQVGVVGPVSTRDGKRQTRIIQGNSEILKIYTINHHKRTTTTTSTTTAPHGSAELRLDATIDMKSGGPMKLELAHSDYNHKDWFSAFVPEPEDGCYLATPDGKVASQQNVESVVCWWHMADGAVLGVHEGQVVEYDATTLSPLGIVVSKKQLNNREVLVVEEGTALVLIDPVTEEIEVIHPNSDGSYWRKFQRNKRVRQEEKAREAAAKLWLQRKQHEMNGSKV